MPEAFIGFGYFCSLTFLFTILCKYCIIENSNCMLSFSLENTIMNVYSEYSLVL